jgi:hypothetical protein
MEHKATKDIVNSKINEILTLNNTIVEKDKTIAEQKQSKEQWADNNL